MLDRAPSLARAFDAEVLPLERIGDELTRADVVISSTSAPGFVVDKEQVAAALSARRGRPLLLIDLAGAISTPRSRPCASRRRP
jgi:glutamyl-tRNA reductase